jgi:tryptophan synthase beta chain
MQADRRRKTILFNLSGHGHFDLTAYDAYNSGKIIDVPFSEEKLVEGLAELPLVN